MRGEADRECRAKGGRAVAPASRAAKKQVVKAFHGANAANASDASIKRGAGPLFRRRGGKVETEAEERDEHAARGAVARKRGGKVEGEGRKPNLGRPGRARGGGVGSDLKPLTSAHDPGKPKGKRGFMAESDRTP